LLIQKLTPDSIAAFDDIVGYSDTLLRDQAEIRFYCDNDDKGRMTLVPDIPNVDYSKIGSKPNSQKTTDQEWVDKINGVRDLGDVRPCHSTDFRVSGYTTRGLDLDPKYATQNKNRAVIVVRPSGR
jgi:hypothetical protein